MNMNRLSSAAAWCLLLWAKCSQGFMYRQDTVARIYKEPNRRSLAAVGNAAAEYALHWDNLLVEEHQELVADLQLRRSSWSPAQLEAAGISIFNAAAEPDSDLLGEKIARIHTTGSRRLDDTFTRGDLLLLTTTATGVSRRTAPLPRDCCVMDVGQNWMTVALGSGAWPPGLWEARRLPNSYRVRLDRTAPVAALRAQRQSLQLVRNGQAGSVVQFLADSFCHHASFDMEASASELPRYLQQDCTISSADQAIAKALQKAKETTSFVPNQSQEEAIRWALRRRISLLMGPPGTGKTRVAALLIATALALADDGRVLAVAHSNGAADVLLQALLRMGVPAVRVGRPASVSPAVRHRTVVAMAETHPEVKRWRQQNHTERQTSVVSEPRNCFKQVCEAITKTAPVVVTSCVGAYQLLSEEEPETGAPFPIVVVDEASQTTEPALLCALASAKAEQVVLVGDTRQLPPTVASNTAKLKKELGTSPMERLERNGVAFKTLQVQYRMPPALLHHPSKYFYNGVIKCADSLRIKAAPRGFSWPNTDIPLAFLDVGSDLEVSHEFGGKSNPTEADLVVNIVIGLLQAGDVEAKSIWIISPYAKQVQRIRSELAENKVRNVQVGTVDSFQGRETDVVLVSTVRSNVHAELGFLRDPRRLCVAITRARRSLILVGDEAVLRTSRHWSALLDSCSERGCSGDAEVVTRNLVQK